MRTCSACHGEGNFNHLKPGFDYPCKACGEPGARKPCIKLSPELTQDYGHPIYVCHMDGTDFSGWGRSFEKAYANWRQATQIWYRGKHNV